MLGNFNEWRKAENKSQNDDSDEPSVYCDKNGNIWSGSMNKGVNRGVMYYANGIIQDTDIKVMGNSVVIPINNGTTLYPSGIMIDGNKIAKKIVTKYPDGHKSAGQKKEIQIRRGLNWITHDYNNFLDIGYHICYQDTVDGIYVNGKLVPVKDFNYQNPFCIETLVKCYFELKKEFTIIDNNKSLDLSKDPRIGYQHLHDKYSEFFDEILVDPNDGSKIFFKQVPDEDEKRIIALEKILNILPEKSIFYKSNILQEATEEQSIKPNNIQHKQAKEPVNEQLVDEIRLKPQLKEEEKFEELPIQPRKAVSSTNLNRLNLDSMMIDQGNNSNINVVQERKHSNNSPVIENNQVEPKGYCGCSIF